MTLGSVKSESKCQKLAVAIAFHGGNNLLKSISTASQAKTTGIRATTLPLLSPSRSFASTPKSQSGNFR